MSQRNTKSKRNYGDDKCILKEEEEILGHIRDGYVRKSMSHKECVHEVCGSVCMVMVCMHVIVYVCVCVCVCVQVCVCVCACK